MFIFRRACGTFLPYSLYLHRLFQKAYGEVVLRYAVAAKKLILNVSEPPRTAVVLCSKGLSKKYASMVESEHE